MGYVYMVTNKQSGEFYIGSTLKNKNQEYWGRSRLVLEAIEKYGKENFEKMIIHESDDVQELNDVEDILIKKNNPDYNISCCGNYTTEESRKKLSENSIGKNNPLYGKSLSKKHKQKIKDSNIDNPYKINGHIKQGITLNKKYENGELIPIWSGKHLPKEMKEKISNSMKDNKNAQKNKYKCINHNTNETFEISNIGKFIKKYKLTELLKCEFLNYGRPLKEFDFINLTKNAINSIGWEIIAEKIK